MIKIEYNGKNFNGWQVQPEKRTVQKVLQDAISDLLGEEIEITASGRTDSGVHAMEQVAHFDINKDFDLKKLAFAINSKLDKDVRVLSAEEVNSDFNARFSAKKKTYLYKIYCSRISRPLKEDLAVQVVNDLDIEKMQEASKYFIGEHNFFGFCSTGNSVVDFNRTIYDFQIKKNGDEIWFFITGNGFLYNMVRIIIGTLVEVGKGKILPDNIQSIINSKERKLAGETMPAYGLYLFKVDYQ